MSHCASNRCGPRGCGGGCSDFSSKAEQLPNLLAIDVVGTIFEQAIRNMTLRCASLESGLMSPEEYDEAKSKLIDWLVALFRGENPHFETNSEWHQGALADFLREKLNRPTDSDAGVLRFAMTLFADDADQMAHEVVSQASDERSNAARSQMARLWAHLMTGAPDSFEE